jgi:hypothetical protein
MQDVIRLSFSAVTDKLLGVLPQYSKYVNITGLLRSVLDRAAAKAVVTCRSGAKAAFPTQRTLFSLKIFQLLSLVQTLFPNRLSIRGTQAQQTLARST